MTDHSLTVRETKENEPTQEAVITETHAEPVEEPETHTDEEKVEPPQMVVRDAEDESSEMNLTELITEIFTLTQAAKDMEEAINEAAEDEDYDQAEKLQSELSQIETKI